MTIRSFTVFHMCLLLPLLVSCEGDPENSSGGKAPDSKIAGQNKKYLGKTLGEWASELQESPHLSHPKLIKHEKESIPILLATLSTGGTHAKQSAIYMIYNLKEITPAVRIACKNAWDKDGDPFLVLYASAVLYRVNEIDLEEVESIFDDVFNKSGIFLKCEVLKLIRELETDGDISVEILTSSAVKDDGPQFTSAIMGIRNLPSKSGIITNKLMIRLSSTDSQVRNRAVYALLKIGISSDDLTTRLIVIISDGAELNSTRIYAIKLLRIAGPSASKSLPALEELVRAEGKASSLGKLALLAIARIKG